MIDLMKQHIQQSIACKQQILATETLLENISQVSKQMADCLINGGMIHFCGNGGSAADAIHIAAELSGRYSIERRALAAEALNVNVSAITAIANDYGYEEVFARLLESRGRKGDVLVGLSTSGNSANVCKAVEKAKEIGIYTVAMTGEKQSKLSAMTDTTIAVPSTKTPIIQESHIMIGHMMCEIIEDTMFG